MAVYHYDKNTKQLSRADGVYIIMSDGVPVISSSGVASRLKTTDYISGSSLIDNTAISCQPFIASVWSGQLADQVSQGTDGISLNTYGCVKTLFTGFHKEWRLDTTLKVSSLPVSGFGTFVGIFDSGDREFGISYQASSDRLFYATGTAEKLSSDVVDAQYAGCYLDNAYTASDIMSDDITISIDKGSEYLTVLLNDIQRIRLSVSSSGITARTDEEKILVGCTMVRSDIQGFVGQITSFELKSK